MKVCMIFTKVLAKNILKFKKNLIPTNGENLICVESCEILILTADLQFQSSFLNPCANSTHGNQPFHKNPSFIERLDLEG